MTWPFKYINGEQTPESKALKALPQSKPLTPYAAVMSDPDTEDALL